MSQPTTHASAGVRAKRAWLLALLTAAALAAPSVRAADDESERENLARIAHEIQRLQAMVSAAAHDAPTGQRVKFRYDWLQNDLEMLREGVERHVDAARQPRPVPPLRGDYRQ